MKFRNIILLNKFQNKFLLTSLLILILSISLLAQDKTASDFFQEGIKFAQNNQIEEALEAFQQSARLNPKEAATHSNIGMALVLLKRGEEAVKAYKEAIRLVPDQASMHVGLCRALRLTEQLNEAVKTCDKAFELEQSSLEVNKERLYVYQLAKRPPTDILQIVQNALLKFPKDIDLLNIAAVQYLNLKDTSQALETYQRISEILPNKASYKVMIAELSLQLERDENAINAARKAIELEPNNATANYLLGRIYFELGQHNEAKAAYLKVTELSPKRLEAWYYLGLSEKRSGNLKAAISAMRKVVELSPDQFNYLAELGRMLSSAGEYEEAVNYLQKANSKEPDNIENKIGLGFALFQSRRYEEGINMLSEADRMKPDDGRIKQLLNVARARRKGFSQINSMRSIARRKPRDLNVRMNLIQFLGYAGRIDEAEPYIQDILRTKSRNINIYQTIGIVYVEVREYDKAIQMFEKSLKIKENEGAYLNLANVYTKRGEIDKAMFAFEKVIELKPNVPNVMKIYADLLRDNGRKREALAMYKRSLSLFPTNSPALFNAGMLSVRFNQIEEAKQYLETLKAIDISSAKTLARYIRLNDR